MVCTYYESYSAVPSFNLKNIDKEELQMFNVHNSKLRNRKTINFQVSCYLVNIFKFSQMLFIKS